jgi:hypothetical protein
LQDARQLTLPKGPGAKGWKVKILTKNMENSEGIVVGYKTAGKRYQVKLRGVDVPIERHHAKLQPIAAPLQQDDAAP